jgi:hypothetical protein
LYAADWAFGWSGLESEPVFANYGELAVARIA